jgi:hypothetical protein
MVWGNDNVDVSTTVRFLSPGSDSIQAEATTKEFRLTRAGTLSALRVHARAAGTGTFNLSFTVIINGVATAIVATGAVTLTDWSDLVHSVGVAAGDLIGIEVTKSGIITASPDDIFASLQYA